ncbi:kinase-like domain-containing protein [Mycena polygramma]|nr:kinase-like domain-containing protein [Mycena polygramma]
MRARTQLVDGELEWARYQPFLEERGYMLRPRYRPGWVSEVLTTGKTVLECEDSFPIMGEVLDATRMSDGIQVVLKMVKWPSNEVYIAEFLTDHPGANKHVVPVLEVIIMPDDGRRAFMVMPRMRQCNENPDFETVGEVMEFVQQVLEGLVYLHRHNIAHRDICPNNLVVDASRIIPGGFHFGRVWTSDGVHELVRYKKDGPQRGPIMKTRTEAGPMQYYYIDFGHSVFDPSFETRELVTGEYGQRRKHIPEISATVPYDPFKVDVRSIGEMLRKDFLFFYIGLEFMIPFVQQLRRRDPARRPDAAEALRLFQNLVSNLTEKQLAKTIPLSFSRKRRAWLFFKGLRRH